MKPSRPMPTIEDTENDSIDKEEFRPFKFLVTRFKAFSHTTFIFNFFVVMIGVGGIGIWLTRDATSFNVGIATYALAIAASAMAEFFLRRQHPKQLSAVVLTLFLLSLVCSLAILIPFYCPARVCLAPACALMIWLVNNADNPIFKDDVLNLAATGGDKDQPPAGTLAGFDVEGNQ
jgi:hypothetical protein